MSTNTLIPQANPQNKCCRRASLQTGNVSELYIAGGPKIHAFHFQVVEGFCEQCNRNSMFAWGFWENNTCSQNTRFSCSRSREP